MKNYRSVIAVLVAGLIATAAFAQTAAPLTGDALMQALIAEIRTLRTTLQRNSAYEIRARLLLDRARMYQENIRELSREVENSTDFMRSPEMDSTMETE